MSCFLQNQLVEINVWKVSLYRPSSFVRPTSSISSDYPASSGSIYFLASSVCFDRPASSVCSWPSSFTHLTNIVEARPYDSGGSALSVRLYVSSLVRMSSTPSLCPLAFNYLVDRTHANSMKHIRLDLSTREHPSRSINEHYIIDRIRATNFLHPYP